MARTNYVDVLPGVPHVESPFFSDFFVEGDPLYPVAKALNERGYAVIDFPEDEMAAVADRIRGNLQAHFNREGGTRVQDAWQFDADVRRLATNAPMIALLSALYGRAAFPFQTLNFPVGTQQHYHSDSIHFSSMPERFMCGVWVALEDVGEEQGPLVYYPGSHRWPIYTNAAIGHTHAMGTPGRQETYEPLWERLVETWRVEPEHFYPRKGQALIWAANLLHGGARQIRAERSRWSQVTHYYFEDCAYYTPMLSNEPKNEIFARQPFNILTGERMECRYNGEAIDPGLGRFGENVEPPFDPAAYLAMNDDVARAGVDPYRHYVEHGQRERRRWY